MAKASETPLTTLEFRVLLVLMDGDLHGYAISKEIERRDSSLGKIFPTNLYRRLRDMAERGLIDHLPASSNGDNKRQFRITKLGASRGSAGSDAIGKPGAGRAFAPPASNQIQRQVNDE